MSVWHADQHKKKPSGGRRKANRTKRRYEKGSFPTETTLGGAKIKVSRRRGDNTKIRLVTTNQANVSEPATGKQKRQR